MPPKRKTPPPIDRPLSKAYLRAFTGWSTAYPPGTSEPTSLRIMENMMVDRNQALAVRPGLRYLSFANSPDIDPVFDKVPGKAVDRPMVGTQEPFYTTTGDKALLFAVREADGKVGWRAILFTGSRTVVHRLTDPEIGFKIPQGEDVLNFSSATTHVDYLQIDNKIIAMSDAGESIRLFNVGAEKLAKKLNSIERPDFSDGNKLTVVHPNEAWITKRAVTQTRNELPNPSFESGTLAWSIDGGSMEAVAAGSPVSNGGSRVLAVKSLPTRTNLQTNPLGSVALHGYPGWHPHKDWGDPDLSKSGGFLKITDKKGAGTFLAYGSKLTDGVAAGQRYVVALDYEHGTHVQPIVVLTFYNAAGAKIGKSTSLEMPLVSGTDPHRYVSPGVAAPSDTVAMRVSVGGRNQASSSTFVKARNVVLCREGEDTAAFDGDSGTYFFWAGTPRESVSVYHPPRTVTLTSARVGLPGGQPACASVYARGIGGESITIGLQQFTREGALQTTNVASSTLTGTFARASKGATTDAQTAFGGLQVLISTLAKGSVAYLDAAQLETGTATPTTYFDGDTPPVAGTAYSWAGGPHESPSVKTTHTTVPDLPVANTPAANSLVSSDASKNTYKVGFFYTFENEVGESAPSKITEIRVMRPWANWLWQAPSATGEPTTPTAVAELCADQLAATIPQAVYDQALVEGAIRWNLYVMAWSDQEPVPVVASLARTRDLRGKPLHKDAGWLAITPARRIGLNEAMLPTAENRVNYSDPPRARAGLVAGDRLILLGDPRELATIRWTSNRPGEYLNFTAARGGGAKTLTTGNLYIPADVVLWQNPQSVDTLTILTMGSDGRSLSFYMMPASINAQSGSTSVMGFEETTSTPGTLSPYGNEVLNNALYRPLDRALLKSTANNYNINHKTQTDKIANMWQRLWSKEWIMSAQLDNRLYYLVHNPLGAVLEPGCKGNEIWVYDISAENGHWSRFLIQGCALRVFNVGPKEVLGVTKPDGLYYLDPTARVDDYVGTDRDVLQRPIEWRFETNTQGANRAHDAWAHLQQVQLTFGDFLGSMRFGIRGKDVNGSDLEFVKEFVYPGVDENDGFSWDVDDVLLIRRDLKEWFLFGSSVAGTEGWGRVSYAQYRYTPVSVNVGYEYGSVETFEYGANPEGYSLNGIPLPYIDYLKP